MATHWHQAFYVPLTKLGSHLVAVLLRLGTYPVVAIE